jgi:hypothetical protein
VNTLSTRTHVQQCANHVAFGNNSRAEDLNHARYLVKYLFEPQLVGLVNDYEEHLFVSRLLIGAHFAERALRRQQSLDLQIVTFNQPVDVSALSSTHHKHTHTVPVVDIIGWTIASWLRYRNTIRYRHCCRRTSAAMRSSLCSSVTDCWSWFC